MHQAAQRAFIKRCLSTSRWILGPAALLFFAWAAWRARDTISTMPINPQSLVFATVLWASLHLLTPYFTATVLHETGAGINYRTVLRIYLTRLPARYMPGGIWHTVTRAIDLHGLGVAHWQLSSMVLLENIIPVGSALVLGSLFLFLGGHGEATITLAAGVGGLIALTCAPLVLRHRLLLHARRLSVSAYLKIIGLSTAFWLIAATAFACYWSAFPSASDGSVPLLRIYGVYLLAWAAGFISVFAPQGIGVFEAVAAGFLKGIMTFSAIAVLTAGFRSVTLAADLLAYVVLHAAKHVSIAIRARH